MNNLTTQIAFEERCRRYHEALLPKVVMKFPQVQSPVGRTVVNIRTEAKYSQLTSTSISPQVIATKVSPAAQVSVDNNDSMTTDRASFSRLALDDITGQITSVEARMAFSCYLSLLKGRLLREGAQGGLLCSLFV